MKRRMRASSGGSSRIAHIAAATGLLAGGLLAPDTASAQVRSSIVSGPNTVYEGDTNTWEADIWVNGNIVGTVDFDYFRYGTATWTTGTSASSPASSSDPLPTNGYYSATSVSHTGKYLQNGSYTLRVSGTTNVYDHDSFGWGSDFDFEGQHSFAASKTVHVLNRGPSIQTTRLRDAAGNVSSGNLTIDEGSGVTAWMTATDPGQDYIDFSIGGTDAGQGGNTAGSTRASEMISRSYTDQGTHTLTFRATDQDGATDTVNRTVTVRNVVPTLTEFSLSSNVVRRGTSVDATLRATDPGADTLTFFLNGASVGTNGVTSGTRSVTTSISPVADQTLVAKVNDGDGGWSSTISQSIDVVGPEFASSLAGLTDLGTTTGDPLAMSFSVSNVTTDIGPDALTGLTLLDAFFEGSDAGLFSLSGFNPGMVLSGGTSSLFDILFTPGGSHGPKTARLIFVTDQNAAFGTEGDRFGFDVVAHATPEPASLTLLGLGIVGAVPVLRRNMRRKASAAV